MAHFCTQCGTRNDIDDALFCTQCGHRFKKKPAAEAASAPQEQASAQQSPAHAKRRWLIPALLLAVLAVAGGGAYIALRQPVASKEVFAEAINVYLRTHRENYQDKVCLHNFDYARNPVFTNPLDGTTNSWLRYLVQAGLYTAPETVVNNGFFRTQQLRYTMTPKGLSAVKNGHLCLATGIRVERIDAISVPEKFDDKLLARASVHYALDAPADWVKPEILQQLPNAAAASQQPLDLVMVVQDGKWVVKAPFLWTNQSLVMVIDDWHFY